MLTPKLFRDLTTKILEDYRKAKVDIEESDMSLPEKVIARRERLIEANSRMIKALEQAMQDIPEAIKDKDPEGDIEIFKKNNTHLRATIEKLRGGAVGYA